MTRHVYYFVYLLVISASVSISGIYAETSTDFQISHNEIDLKNAANFAVDSMNEAFAKGACNSSGQCLNGGYCLMNDCVCPKEYEGALCETPTWCTWGRCGFGGDVECVWNRERNEGECRCTKERHVYSPKERECVECDCGGHGKCQAVDDVLVCKCDDRYAIRSSATKCEACDCGLQGSRCSFASDGLKVCHCPKGYAQNTDDDYRQQGIYCRACDCGEHGRCSWRRGVKECDCEAGYKFFKGRCLECDCGNNGICNLENYGDKVCNCDYGFAETEGKCQECDCNALSTKRTVGANCSFVDGLKECECPPGYKVGKEYCEDIDECISGFLSPCSSHATCINKPGTFECKCEPGFRPVRSQFFPYTLPEFDCVDIDECLEYPCQSHLTTCVNSPGSFDCACAEGYYPTAGTQGPSYRPAHNDCYETPTQWRGATIAIGVILSFAIIVVSFYIMKHKK